jgi:hypothetical protein
LLALLLALLLLALCLQGHILTAPAWRLLLLPPSFLPLQMPHYNSYGMPAMSLHTGAHLIQVPARCTAPFVPPVWLLAVLHLCVASGEDARNHGLQR